MPCVLLDGNARIDSNPDRVHARGALPESTRGFPHELHVLHDAVFVFGPERPNRLQARHGAFMRDRSQVPYAKVLTKYDCTKLVPYLKVLTKYDCTELDQNFLRAVVRNIREASTRKIGEADPNRLEWKTSHEGGQNRPFAKSDMIPCVLL